MDANTNPTITSTDDDDDGPDYKAKFLSRKFLITLLFAVAGVVALFTHFLAASDFLWLVSIILIGHGTSNIVDKKINP